MKRETRRSLGLPPRGTLIFGSLWRDVICGRTRPPSIMSPAWVGRGAQGPCIEFVGRRDSDGYGVIGGFANRAHRAAYVEAFGAIPPGMEVAHMCDNPACIAVAHLQLATHADNMRDMHAKGRVRYFRKFDAAVIDAVRASTDGYLETCRRLGVSKSMYYEFRRGR
jgi:hypothetical protein